MGKRYSDETKAAVMAALLAGQGVAEIADEYNIPPATIRTWRSRQDITVSEEVADRIGYLLLEYLEANLETLKAQTRHFADPRWLSKQQAQELAVLHGVMADKAIRLLEAMGKGHAADG